MKNRWERLCGALIECTEEGLVEWTSDDDSEAWSTRDADGRLYTMKWYPNEIILAVREPDSGQYAVHSVGQGDTSCMHDLWKSITEMDPVTLGIRRLEDMIARRDTRHEDGRKGNAR